MRKIRALVVEDSATVRERLVEVLAAQPDIEVVGVAGDGKEGIELCQRLRPDVITLDMMLPVMSGLAATEYIMAHCPTPILVVSASTNRGELYKTYEALAAGAVDVLEKPRGDEGDGVWEAKLVATVRMVSRIRVITHPRGRLGLVGQPRPVSAGTAGDRPETRPASADYRVIAIGASTGGPGALVDILRGLPTTMQIPILVVLHIGEVFAVAMADWLDSISERRVTVAAEGEPVAALRGRVVMAPAGRHLLVRNGRIAYSGEAERHSCRPSVDVLFESVAREYGAAAVGCLLTGMGRDGAAGLAAMHLAGAYTIAQDEATSVVYGMPREAALLGAATRVLPLDEIASVLTALATGEPGARP